MRMEIGIFFLEHTECIHTEEILFVPNAEEEIHRPLLTILESMGNHRGKRREASAGCDEDKIFWIILSIKCKNTKWILHTDSVPYLENLFDPLRRAATFFVHNDKCELCAF